jgi:hypothetical protein
MYDRGQFHLKKALEFAHQIKLFYFILFYFILFYFILFYFILFHFILFYFILSQCTLSSYRPQMGQKSIFSSPDHFKPPLKNHLIFAKMSQETILKKKNNNNLGNVETFHNYWDGHDVVEGENLESR